MSTFQEQIGANLGEIIAFPPRIARCHDSLSRQWSDSVCSTFALFNLTQPRALSPSRLNVDCFQNHIFDWFQNSQLKTAACTYGNAHYVHPYRYTRLAFWAVAALVITHTPANRPENITIKSDAESVYIHGLFQQRCRDLGINTACAPPHQHGRNGSSEKTSREALSHATTTHTHT